ncbi:glycine zipper domain-containing protein [Gammaproteobacteria bacterium]|nr:glycine zipper domain-containing protein [Gammaproteobacteria bacterium]
MTNSTRKQCGINDIGVFGRQKSVIKGSILGLCLLVVSGTALAQSSYESVAVISAQPVYQLTRIETPQERCVEERVVIERRNQQASGTPIIVSTIIGGALGNAVGNNKSSRRVGAVLGAVLGNSVGRDIAHQSQSSDTREYQTVERCETVFVSHEEERLLGYDVIYEFNGQQYSVRTEQDPGSQMKVRVEVQPVF